MGAGRFVVKLSDPSSHPISRQGRKERRRGTANETRTPLYTAFPRLPAPEKLLRKVRQLLARGVLTNRGPLVHEFEKKFARSLLLQPSQAATCANATLGMELTLRALNLRGEVIVPAFTFVSTVSSIVHAGLTPVFADIDPVSLCLCPKSVESRLTAATCAVLPVHVFGRVGEVEYFEGLRQRGLKVVYDAAHAVGVQKKGASLGQYGDASVYSFHATKILMAGEGGAVVGQDEALLARVRLASNHGIEGEESVECIGTNAKMSEIHALFALHCLQHLEPMIASRVALCGAYDQALQDVDGISPLTRQAGVTQNGQYYPVLLRTPAARDALYTYLRQREIFARKYFYPPIYRLAAYRSLAKIELPVTDDISDRILCLPLHGEMTAEDVGFIVATIGNSQLC